MGYKYRGDSKYPDAPKNMPTHAEYNMMLDKLEKLMPMTREEIIMRAVQKYFFKKIVDKNSWSPGEVLRAHNHRCFYCKKVLSNRTVTIDHKVPMSRGGTNTEDNIVPACDKCNNDKGSMTVEEYAEYLSGLGLSPVFMLTNTRT